MTPSLSVLICSHNPRADHLERVLTALRHQTLATSQWELLLIDNASSQRLASRFDLSWHPHARHVCEERLGVVYARMRSIAEAQGALCVFVDDDNLLAADYLTTAKQIAEQRPDLGAWGGSIAPEFETTPPAWSRAFWSYLAIREINEDRWSMQEEVACLPWGAGMCFRKLVGDTYRKIVADDARRTLFGPRGDDVTFTAEDVDIALTACDLGLGIGVFHSLRLTHLIPPARLEPGYLLRLVHGIDYSGHILKFIRTGAEPPQASLPGLLNLYWIAARRPRYERARFLVSRRALKRARQTIAELCDRDTCR